MTKRKTGIVLIIGSIAVWLIEWLLEHPISNLFGEMFCANRYMQPVDGIVGDVSCGFNSDLYLVVFICTVLLTGIVLVIVNINSLRRD